MGSRPTTARGALAWALGLGDRPLPSGFGLSHSDEPLKIDPPIRASSTGAGTTGGPGAHGTGVREGGAGRAGEKMVISVREGRELLVVLLRRR